MSEGIQGPHKAAIDKLSEASAILLQAEVLLRNGPFSFGSDADSVADLRNRLQDKQVKQAEAYGRLLLTGVG